MEATQILEEIVTKSKQAMQSTLEAAKEEGILDKENIQKIYDVSNDISIYIVDKLSKVDDREEIVLSTAFSLINIVSNTLKIYMEDNNIEIGVADIETVNDAPYSMYL